MLRDIAVRAAADGAISPAFFTAGNDGISNEGIRLSHGMTMSGWGFSHAVQFTRSLASIGTETDLVHLAHVPTALNSYLLARLRTRGNARGVRYVQTVTALPQEKRIRKELFWGDAITCINPKAADIVAEYHPRVRMILPIPNPTRLANRSRMPTEFVEKLENARVVCCPIITSRMAPYFPLVSVCEEILSRYENVKMVFACRFGEERQARRWLGSLCKPYRDRVDVIGTVSWILDLFSRSDVVVYPTSDLAKKFNPPLALLEAAHLGAGIVAAPNVHLDGIVDESALITVDSNNASAWTDAIASLLESSPRCGSLKVSFEESYGAYKQVYGELLGEN